MNKEINVLDITMNDYSAKEALREVVQYLQTEPINLVSVLTAKSLVDAVPEFKENIEQFDMVLAGDKAILSAAGINERKKMQEAESHLFLKMFLKYLHKQKKKAFLLVQTPEDLTRTREYMESFYSGIQVVDGMAVEVGEISDDLIVNRINGTEVDVIIAMLSAPLKEAFVLRNRLLLDARIWLAIGREIKPLHSIHQKKNRLSLLWARWVLKKEVEKYKKEG